jgi:Ca2+-binding EF-hand superfamily protein
MGRTLDDDALEELREIFEHFDKDHNGVIDRQEFAELLAALSAGMSKAEADVGFREVDTNKNGVIEFREFVRWWRDH